MIDQELSAALRVYYQAWYDHFYDPDRRTPGAVVPTINERFIASVGSPRAEELLQEILLLQAEVVAVPDPGGPIGNCGQALDEWAATHPEIDPRSVHWITSRLLRAAM